MMNFEIYENQEVRGTVDSLYCESFTADNEEQAVKIFLSNLTKEHGIDYMIMRKVNDDMDISYTIKYANTDEVVIEIAEMQGYPINAITGEVI